MATILPLLGLVFLFIISVCVTLMPVLMKSSVTNLDDSESTLVFLFTLVAIGMWLTTGYSVYEYIQHY
jgi:hypothetical protein